MTEICPEDKNQVYVDKITNEVIVTSSGPQGIPGEYAAMGIQGKTGIQGLQGLQGPKGLPGDVAFAGAQGIQGIQGYGYQQLQGTQGLQGPAGSMQGIQGIQGIQGLNGVQGIQGTDGTQGTQGTTGNQGEVGVGLQGPAGPIGIQGIVGAQGTIGFSVQGIQGSSGIGTQGVQGTQGTRGGNLANYLSAYDTTDQTAIATNTGYAIQLNTIESYNNITVENNLSAKPTRIKFAEAGVYNIQYSIQWENSKTDFVNTNVWLTKNGSGYPDSNTMVTVDAKHSGVNGFATTAANYVINVNANDYVELYWSTEDVLAIISTIAASGPAPQSPGIIVTVTQAQYTAIGPQGLKGIQGVQGIQGFGYAQLQGIQGMNGNAGLQGTQGIQGISGAYGTIQTVTNSNDPGIQGTVLYDGSYIYVCTATNTWKRTTISSW